MPTHRLKRAIFGANRLLRGQGTKATGFDQMMKSAPIAGGEAKGTQRVHMNTPIPLARGAPLVQLRLTHPATKKAAHRSRHGLTVHRLDRAFSNIIQHPGDL